MDYFSDYLIISLLIAMFSGSHYLMYKIGIGHERRAYTEAFKGEVEIAYNQGFEDGNTVGAFKSYKVGFDDGKKQGYDKCLSEDFKMKDSY